MLNENMAVVAFAAVGNGKEQQHYVRYIDILVGIDVRGVKKVLRNQFFSCDMIADKHRVDYVNKAVAVHVTLVPCRLRRL